MNQNLTEGIGGFILNLSSSEKKTLQAFLTLSETSQSSPQRLLELLDTLSTSSKPEIELPKKKKAKDAYRKNIGNLEDKVLDSLLLDVSLDRNGRYSLDETFSLVLLKDRMKADLLNKRGSSQRGFDKMKRTVERYIALQDYDGAATCLQQQISSICLHANPKVYKEQVSMLSLLKRKQFIRDKATALFLELRMKKYFQVFENLDVFIEDAIAELIRHSAECDSKVIAYTLMYFEKEWAELKGDYHFSLECIYKMQKLLEDNFYFPQLQSPFELIYEQARLLIELNCYSEAKAILLVTKAKLDLTTACGQAVYELLFVTDLSQGKLLEAEETLNEVRSVPYFTDGMPIQHKTKWDYFACILYFRLQYTRRFAAQLRLKSVFKNLSNPDEKLRLKIMEVLAAIDADEHDVADRLQDSLRKHISRNNLKEVVFAKHLFQLTDLLWQLKYCGYDLSRLHERNIDVEAFIADIQDIYVLMPLNHSLIRWDLWFTQKLEHETNVTDLYHRILCERRERYYETGVLSRLIV